MERKGICKNVGVCSKANKVQIITDDDAEFICPECGSELQEYKEPEVITKKKNKLPLIIGGVIVAAAVIGGCIWLSPGGSNEPGKTPEIDTTEVDTVKPTPVQPDTVVVRDTLVVRDTVINQVPVHKDRPAKNPSWGKYDGARDGSGLPHGNGVLRITRSTTINGETAQPGERIEGVFRNGYLNMGTWYKNDGNAVVVKDVKVL